MDRSATGNPPVEFRVLGPIELRVAGVAVEIGGFRQRRLLAVLLSRAGAVVETDTLAEYVWDDDDRPDNAVEAARTYISRLRRSLGDAGLDAASVLATQAPGYRLVLDDADLDSRRFERLILDARSQLDEGDAVSALVALDEAIALWRGTPYQEFADRPWVEGEVARLAELRRVAVEQRAAARLDLGAHAEVIGELEQLVADDPLRTRPVELLMLALYRSGRQAEALRVGSRYRHAVADVGLDPPEPFSELEARIAAADDGLRPLAASTDTIRGYRLADQIGEGSFSVVFRSVQPSLGREVAVKQIRAELADRPDFIRRFEAEAQTVATLEHPHIVPLYDYWREPGSAYLVMRWLRGGTLEARLRRQRLDADESVTLATQIGSALATAHHAGVEHRDVRSANVFLDEIGNHYLGDFGIATDGDGRDHGDDVRGLGTVLFEAVTGARPDGDRDRPALSSLRPDLPDAVEPVLLRAIVGGGDEAYASVEELVDDYVTAVHGTTPRRSGAIAIPLAEDVVNPYKGLRAFQESDADDFRGRDRLIERLLHQLAEPGTAGRLVAAVGPSGSGKSSLVRAGLVPRLRSGAIAGSDSWFITTMLPGARPFDELEAALNRIATTPTAGLAEHMADSSRGIGRAVNSTLPDEAGELLVVIDQFEELFTLTEDDTRAAFLDGLVDAVSAPRSRLRVVITIRADHWHRPLQHAEFAQLLETSAVTVTPMAADELERAVVDPARSMGVTFEAGLVADIIAEVHDQPGALPLMQYLLTELFDARERGLMQLDTYQRLGGVAGSLARRADELHEHATEAEQADIRRLFSRLITPGEGTEDTRRRVGVTELATLADGVVERYGEARLLTFDHDPATREPTVEVAHEALIREWPRLRAWVDEDRDGLRTLRRLTAAATDWDAAGRPAADLYQGARLETAESLAERAPDDLTPLEHDYVAAGIHRRDAEADAERRRVRRLRGLLAATATIAVIALVAGALAWTQQRRADDNAREAEAERDAAEELGRSEAEARAEADAARDDEATARLDAEAATGDALRAREDAEVARMRAQAVSLRSREPSLAMLLALEAIERRSGSESLGALLGSLQRTDGWLGHVETATEASRDQWIGALDDDTAVVRTSTSIDVYDLGTQRLVHSEPSSSRSGEQLAIQVDVLASGSVVDGRFATVDGDGRVVVVGPEPTAVEHHTLDGTRASAVGLARGAAFIVGGFDGRVEVRQNGADDVPVALGAHPAPVVHAVLSPDGGTAATQDMNGSLTVWDVQTGEARWTWTIGMSSEQRIETPTLGWTYLENGGFGVFSLYEGGPPPVDVDFALGFGSGRSLSFSQDGQSLRYLAATSLVTLDPGTGLIQSTVDVPAFASQVTELSGGAILTGNVVVRNGEVERLNGVPADARVAVTPNGTTVLALTGSGLSTFGTTGDRLLARAIDRDGDDVATVSGDGTRVASLEFDDWDQGDTFAGRLTDVQSRTDLWPDGVATQWLSFTGDDHFAQWGWPQPLSITPLDGTSFFPTGARTSTQGWGTFEFSPDQQLLAIGDIARPQVRIHDNDTGEIIKVLESPLNERRAEVEYLDFASDGRLLAVAVPHHVAVWETTTWELVGSLPAQPGDVFGEVTFQPDGSALAIGTDDGRVLLWDLSSMDPSTLATGVSTAVGTYDMNRLEYSADGRFLVVAGSDVTVLDAATGSTLGGRFPNETLQFGASIGHGATAVVTGTEDHLLVWNLDPETWPEIACQAAGRNMTLDEWEQFGMPGEPYSATCEQWPAAA